jgi:Holliday junction resolvase RusA-like endonuclease
MLKITIFIPGSPFGKERHRDRIVENKTTGAQFVTHYTPTKTVKYEKLIGQYGVMAMIGKRRVEAAPVKLKMIAIFDIPKSWPKWKREMAEAGDLLPVGKPDLDNIAKCSLDGLNLIVWRDDSQVVNLITGKRYRGVGEKPGLLLSIEEIAKLPSTITKKPK